MERALRDRRILVVEDEYFVADEMRQLLERDGADVVGPVASVGEALKLLEATARIDAAILDVDLGGDLVYPLAEALAARDVPCIFATGYDVAAIPERYAASIKLEKPIVARHLRAALDRLRKSGD